jgi:putative ABC transport system ATP-binding protein
VAIARALVNDPAIILADEPTGNLDSKSGREIVAIMQSLNREKGLTVVFVTHDRNVALHTGRIIHLIDGRISDEELVADPMSVAVEGVL